MEITIEELKKLIEELTETAQRNLLYYAGDHWQDGNGWSGAMLPESHESYESALRNLERAFTSRNVIREIVDHYISALLGQRVQWQITEVDSAMHNDDMAQNTSEEASELVAEATELLNAWWKQLSAITEKPSSTTGKLMQTTPQDVVKLAVADALNTSRGVFRLFINPAVLSDSAEKDGEVVIREPRQAIHMVRLSKPQPAQATVFIDNSMKPVGVYSYTVVNERGERTEEVELHRLAESDEATSEDGTTTRDEADQPLSEVAIVTEDTTTSSYFDLGGQLAMHELSLPMLIDSAGQRTQMMVNKAKSGGSLNLDWASMLERTILNGQMPGKIEVNPDTGKEEFRPEPFLAGPGVTNFIAGLEMESEQGHTRFATPRVVYKEPTPGDVFIDSEESAVTSLFMGAGLLYILLAGEGAPSAQSRREARTVFLKRLEPIQSKVSNSLEWLLKTVLALTAELSGEPGRYANIDIDVNMRIDLGPPLIEEAKDAREAWRLNLLSTPTTVQRHGIQNPDTELRLIEDERQRRVEEASEEQEDGNTTSEANGETENDS